MATAIVVLCIIAFSLYINFLPAIIAVRRKHDNRVSILLINIFLGWTGVVWIIALVWALSGKKDAVEKTVVVNNHVFVQGHQSTMQAALPYAPEPELQVIPQRAYVPVPASPVAFGRRG